MAERAAVSRVPGSGDIVEYRYVPRISDFLLFPLMILAFAVAIAFAVMVKMDVCVSPVLAGCIGNERHTAALYAFMGLALLIPMTLVCVFGRKGHIRLSPEAVEVDEVARKTVIPFKDITLAQLTPAGAYTYLRLATNTSGAKIHRRWLEDAAAFDDISRTIESRAERYLAIMPKQGGSEPVTTEAILIAVVLPSAIIAMIYLAAPYVPILFLIIVALLVWYGLRTLAYVLYKGVGKKLGG